MPTDTALLNPENDPVDTVAALTKLFDEADLAAQSPHNTAVRRKPSMVTLLNLVTTREARLLIRPGGEVIGFRMPRRSSWAELKIRESRDNGFTVFYDSCWTVKTPASVLDHSVDFYPYSAPKQP